ncbi:hypothetical protein C0Q70_11318 [Pomacea canaliculata]|uniref:G-protein coupled receptors family 1 profile domain-containing protein n=1 Tax=Pomacea canaliculata TaxID=400727 RepID=A0A2T7P5M3_POMCA|nr:hypothetical protein C0Q70_11318 [Pomacea canaliculata]
MATSITVIKLRTAAMWRENTSSSSAANQSRQLALTRMLITVSCAYIVSMVPFVMIFLTRLFVQDFSLNGRNSNLYLLCSMIVNLFPLAHGSVNLFIYLWRSSRYRQAVFANKGRLLTQGVQKLREAGREPLVETENLRSRQMSILPGALRAQQVQDSAHAIAIQRTGICLMLQGEKLGDRQKSIFPGAMLAEQDLHTGTV